MAHPSSFLPTGSRGTLRTSAIGVAAALFEDPSVIDIIVPVTSVGVVGSLVSAILDSAVDNPVHFLLIDMGTCTAIGLAVVYAEEVKAVISKFVRCGTCCDETEETKLKKTPEAEA